MSARTERAAATGQAHRQPDNFWQPHRNEVTGRFLQYLSQLITDLWALISLTVCDWQSYVWTMEFLNSN